MSINLVEVLNVEVEWRRPVHATDSIYRENDLSQTDGAKDLFFFLLSVPKEDLANVNLAVWTEATLKNLSGSFEKWEVIEQSSSSAPGPPAIELLLECANENRRWILFTRFLDTPDHYLWARVVATRSGFREHEDTLRRIVRSVRSE